MIGIPFCILGLAAGVYLLIQVKHYGFTGIYKLLAWLVILLSLLFMVCISARAVMHHRQKQCMQSGQCDMKGGSESCPYMKEGSCCKDGNKPMGDMGHCAMSSTGCSDMPCCAKSHCAPGSTEGCCAKSGGEMKCDGGKDGAKPACCHKDGEAKGDSTAHK